MDLNESYIHEDKINLKEEIQKIFKYLRDTGEFPYKAPRVLFAKGDAQNSHSINMSTAFYDYDDDEITLYINDRHPRDLICSFLHELRHCYQNREGRLNNLSQSENIVGDNDLEQLEREAYEYSGIWFRKYKDSQKIQQESKIKDPYGISQFMRELVSEMILEDEQNYKIYVDLDNTLLDFNKTFKRKIGYYPSSYKNKFGVAKLSSNIEKIGERFWKDASWMPGGQQLWNYIEKYNPIILTSQPEHESEKIGKRKWVSNNISSNQEIIFIPVEEKSKYSGKNNIIIDDRQSTVLSWIQKGGIGIYYSNANKVIEELQKLGL